MEKKRKIRRILAAAAVTAAFLAVFVFLNILVQPKYAEDLVEGSMISQYYGDARGHDLIFIGDCEVYSNISPMEMYRQAAEAGKVHRYRLVQIVEIAVICVNIRRCPLE